MISQETKDFITLIFTIAGICIFVICVLILFIGSIMVKNWNESDSEYYEGLTKLYDEEPQDHICTVDKNGFIECPNCKSAWEIIKHKNCRTCGASYIHISPDIKKSLKFYSNLDEICEGK